MPLEVSRRPFISSCGFSAVEQARYWSTAGEKSTKRALNIAASSFPQIRWSALNSSLYYGLFVSLPCLRGDSWRLIVGTGHICDVLLSYCTGCLISVCRGVLYAAAASCALLSLSLSFVRRITCDHRRCCRRGIILRSAPRPCILGIS